MDIIALIRSKGLTVAAVARESGCSRETIYNLRKANYRPSVDTVAAVANAIGVTPGEISSKLA